MNGTTLVVIRSLKGGNGNYFRQPFFKAGRAETNLGRPVVEALDMPNIAAEEAPIILDVINAGYRIDDHVASNRDQLSAMIDLGM